MVTKLKPKRLQHSGILYKNEKGIVLITALLFLMVLTVLGTTAIMISSTDIKIGGNYKLSKQAFYAAEAGINQVINHYRTTPADFDITKTTASSIGLPGTKPTTANLGTDAAFWITNITYDTASPPTWVEIKGHGTVINSNADSKIVVRLEPIYPNPFTFAAFGDEGVVLSGQGDVDSYNSSVASYDPANPGSNGDVGTNATSNGVISLSGQAEVKGDAVVGPGGDPTTGVTTSGQSSVSGSKSAADSAKDMTPKSDPGGGTPLIVSGTMPIGAGTYRVSSISLSSQTTVTISGNVTLYVTGNFTTSGQSKINITSGSSLTMYVSGDIHMAGQGIVNLNNKPENLIIYGTETCTSVHLSGQAELFGAIYAPKAEAQFTGQADIYGSIIAKTVNVSGQGDIHYDEALSSLGGGGTPSDFNIVFWRDDAL